MHGVRVPRVVGARCKSPSSFNGTLSRFTKCANAFKTATRTGPVRLRFTGVIKWADKTFRDKYSFFCSYKIPAVPANGSFTP